MVPRKRSGRLSHPGRPGESHSKTVKLNTGRVERDDFVIAEPAFKSSAKQESHGCSINFFFRQRRCIAFDLLIVRSRCYAGNCIPVVAAIQPLPIRCPVYPYFRQIRCDFCHVPEALYRLLSRIYPFGFFNFSIKCHINSNAQDVYAQHIGLHRQQAVPHLQPAKGAAKLQW